MNLCFVTARIIDEVKFLGENNHCMAQLNINFPQARNYLANAIARTDSKKKYNLLKLYARGDYVMIEGELQIAKNSVGHTKIIFNVVDIHPVHSFISEQ